MPLLQRAIQQEDTNWTRYLVDQVADLVECPKTFSLQASEPEAPVSELEPELEPEPKTKATLRSSRVVLSKLLDLQLTYNETRELPKGVLGRLIKLAGLMAQAPISFQSGRGSLSSDDRGQAVNLLYDHYNLTGGEDVFPVPFRSVFPSTSAQKPKIVQGLFKFLGLDPDLLDQVAEKFWLRKHHEALWNLIHAEIKTRRELVAGHGDKP